MMWVWLLAGWLLAGTACALLAGAFCTRPPRPVPPSVAEEVETWLASLTSPSSGS